MSIILLENDRKIKNLFNIMFSTIDLNSNNNIVDNNKIKYLLSTDEIKTNEMLDEIYKLLSHQYDQNAINNIFINHKIITNRNNPKFSILSSSNTLNRSLEQASFFNDYNGPQNNNQFNDYNGPQNNNYNGPQNNNQFNDYNGPQNNNYNGPQNKNFDIYLPPKNYYLNDENLNNKLANLENQIATIKSKSDIECETKINTIKTELTNQITDLKNKSKDSIDNYLKLLTDILLKNQIITQNEVDNIKRNLNSNLIDINTVVNYLENKKKLAKNLTINYNFDEIYLNKWNAPLPRPPICISDDPIKIKQIDEYSTKFAPFSK